MIEEPLIILSNFGSIVQIYWMSLYSEQNTFLVDYIKYLIQFIQVSTTH